MKKNCGGLGGVVVILLLALYFVPWKNINWGKLEMSSVQTVTVTGEAELREKNQIASFSAGVTKTKDVKEEAVSEVNEEVDKLIESVKDFGVDKEDIKTQSLNINQREDSVYEEGKQKVEAGQWRVSNTIEIILRDVDRASELADLLAGSGASNVYGPNFSLDDTGSLENELMTDAMKDAKEKAEIIAEASERGLGKVVSVSEGVGGSNYGIRMAYGEMGGGAPMEPGAGTVSKSLTVIFELK